MLIPSISGIQVLFALLCYNGKLLLQQNEKFDWIAVYNYIFLSSFLQNDYSYPKLVGTRKEKAQKKVEFFMLNLNLSCGNNYVFC